MKTLIQNKYLRIAALCLLAECVIHFPYQFLALVLAALTTYYAEEKDLELLSDVKAALSKVDLSKVKKLFNKLEDPVVEQEVVMEPVVKPAPEAPAQEVVEQEVEPTPEAKVKVSKGFGSKI